MSKTVVLLNPYGTDVTNFVNGTAGYPQLLKGSVMDPGDTLYTVPYNNTSGIANIEDGESKLNTYLMGLPVGEEVLVFGYSEGCQIADMWLTDYGVNTPIDPADLSFLLIGHADSKYHGFVYQQSAFDSVGYTKGLPSNVPYETTVFARQYDGVGDFPTDPAVVSEYTELAAPNPSDPNALANWMRALASLLGNTNQFYAVENAVMGMVLIHNFYENVAVTDPQNVEYVDPAQPSVRYVWSPTYPVPLLGTGATFPQSDQQLRAIIEQSYDRPVKIPSPQYANNPSWSVEPFPIEVPPAPVVGWWALLAASFTVGVAPSIGAMTGASFGFDVVPSFGMTAGGVSLAAFALAVTPAIGIAGASKATGTVGLAITPTVGMAGAEHYTAAFGLIFTTTMGMSGAERYTAGFGLTVTPAVGVAASEGYAREFGLALTPAIGVSGAGTSHAAFTLSTAPAIGASGAGTSTAAFGLTLTPAIGATGAEHYTAAFGMGVTPSIGMVGDPVFVTSFTVGVTPAIGAVAEGVSTAATGLTLTPAVGMSAAPVSTAAFGLAVTPAVGVSGAERYIAGFGVAVTSAITATAAGASVAAFGVGVTPAITVSGAERYTAAAGLSVTASIGMAGTGVNGVSGPAYDATGAGNAGQSVTSLSWSHTATAGAYVVVAVSETGFGLGGGVTVTGVRYGGANMTQLGSVYLANSPSAGVAYLYGLSNVAGGAQTVKATFSGSSDAAGGSVSYTGVTSVGSAQTSYGTGTSASLSAAGGGGTAITTQAFGAKSATFSAYSATQRYTGRANTASIVVGDSTAANTTFTATLSSGTASWAGIAVVLS